MKEYKINSISDYLKILPEYNEFSDTLLDNLILYREQGNESWKLLPSVMRNREDYLNEELYIKECLRQYPEEFTGMSKLDVLIKMQHYGMPTRLLDLTKNPLIALYFACISEPDFDGAVYCVCGPVFRSTDLHINAIAENVFLAKSHGKFYNYKKEVMIEGEKIACDSEYILKCDTPIIFETPLNNDRIKQQDGYFAIYRGEDKWGEINYKYKIIIDRKSKKDIIRQLSVLGIDSKFLFPEFVNGVPCIISSIRERNQDFNKQFQTLLD